MNQDRLQTAALVAAAMIVGGGATFFMMKDRGAEVGMPAGQAQASAIAKFSTSHDDELETALVTARSQRAAGKLKPLATTPDEFARALGELNFRLHDFSMRFSQTPSATDATFSAYSDELQTLTSALANLLSDDSLMDKMDADDPKSLAHHQSLLAAGALALDTATATKIEAAIFSAYEKSLPPSAAGRELTEPEAAEFEQKFAALNDEIEQAIRQLLTPEQAARLDSMGRDQVLFGLEQE